MFSFFVLGLNSERLAREGRRWTPQSGAVTDVA
jgi:hypothetical protein